MSPRAAVAGQDALFDLGTGAAAGWELGAECPDLPTYHWVVINVSAGKDSMATLSYVHTLCVLAGVDLSRVVVVHADLGRVEWPGTRELAEAHAATFGLRFETVRRQGVDLLDQVLVRNERLRAKPDDKGTAPPWHGPGARSCTSDFKTTQVATLMTRLVAESRAAGVRGRVRILNVLGIRADESVARAAKTPLGYDPENWREAPIQARPATKRRAAVQGREGTPHGKREVHRWLPIFTWDVARVWAEIVASGMPPHPAYELGMDRLSCVFCFYAPKSQLVQAARYNIGLALAYERVEQLTGFTFKAGLSMTEVIAEALAAGLVIA